MTHPTDGATHDAHMVSQMGSPLSPIRRLTGGTRPVSAQAYLFQIYPLLGPHVDQLVRRRRILSLANRLRYEGSRYIINPFNWWRVIRIVQARNHYSSLIDLALMYDIELPEISW